MRTLTHELKTWPPFFEEVMNGIKSFEIRKDDRGFMVGDTLILREYDLGEYTGRQIEKIVKYKLIGGQFGVEKGYCILGL